MNNPQNNEIYLNHPTFGLLYRICLLGDNTELYTTLYAQRLFFIVETAEENILFNPLTRSDARIKLEARLRELRYLGLTKEYQELQAVYRRTFF
ncbi:MAG: DUF3539 family protein [Cyanobacteria bacterium J083]|nr:MAG: DUF3539 family protein [Cyanobacteria bacterium J083]